MTPNTNNLLILEEACRKQGYKPEEYDLKHYNNVLDLSSTVRYSNLANNAQLELVKASKIRHEGLVSLALQLESGKRLVGDFAPLTTLWEVVNHWEESRELIVQNPNGEDVDPGCVYMRNEIIGMPKLEETTLRNLGLTSGKAVLWLIFRSKGNVNVQAFVDVPLPKLPRRANETTGPPSPVAMDTNTAASNQERVATTRGETSPPKQTRKKNEPKVRDPSPPAAAKEQQDTTPMDVSSDNNQGGTTSASSREDQLLSLLKKSGKKKPAHGSTTGSKAGRGTALVESFSENVLELGERNAFLFCLDNITRPPNEEVPDDFFNLTVEDVKYLMADLRRRRQALENMPLQTRTLREAELQAKMEKYKTTVIRIFFPGRLALQATFKSSETVSDIMAFVRKFILQRIGDFYLFTAPPKTVLNPEATLFVASLVPKAIVHFGCDFLEEHPIREEFRNRLSASSVETRCTAHAAEAQVVHQAHSKQASSSSDRSVVGNPAGQARSAGDASSNTVPRWFKPGEHLRHPPKK